MPEEILSQNEIDDLLSALSSGEMDANQLKEEESDKKVKIYDFKRALRFSKDQIRSISRIHDNFARLLTTYFSAQLRTYVHIAVASVDQIPYEEFIRSIPTKTILNVYSMEPLNGRIIFEFNPAIAYAMLDRMLGGSGQSVNKIDSLTEIETTLMSQLFEKALENLQEAWESVITTHPTLEEFEINPQFLQLVSPNETVVVVSLESTIGESSGMINICIPHVVLEPIIPKLSAHYWMQNIETKERKPEDYEAISKEINKAELDLSVLLGEASISLEDLLYIQEEDTILLNKKIDQALTLYVDKHPKFLVQPGKRKKKMAIQVLEELEEGTKMKNDGMLSQDEIDALLNGSDNFKADEYSGNGNSVSEYLSSIEEDTIGEIGNISFGSSATTLATILNQKVAITTPTVNAIHKGNLNEEFPVPYVGVEVRYTEGFSGSNLFILESKDAAIIADLMLGGNGAPETDDLNDIHLSAVQEAMNQMMGTAATSMSTVFNKKVDISPPTTSVMDVTEEEANTLTPNDDILIKVSFQLRIGTLIDSTIMQLLPVSFAKDLVDQLLNETDDIEGNSSENKEDTASQEASVKETTYFNASSNASEKNEEAEHLGQYATSASSQPKQIGNKVAADSQAIHAASFSDLKEVSLERNEKRNLDLLMDIPLQVTVELGRTKRTVKEVLELTSGSIIELDKLAGEPVDILVNQKLIAKGEVVVIEENFGVRVTDIVSQEDRLKQLK